MYMYMSKIQCINSNMQCIYKQCVMYADIIMFTAPGTEMEHIIYVYISLVPSVTLLPRLIGGGCIL